MKTKIVVQIDPELEDLIPSYLENLQKNSAEIKRGIEKNEMELCKRLGHNMKGSGGSYGFDFISAIGKEIEDAAKSEKRSEIEDALKKLENYMEQLEISYTT